MFLKLISYLSHKSLDAYVYHCAFPFLIKCKKDPVEILQGLFCFGDKCVVQHPRCLILVYTLCGYIIHIKIIFLSVLPNSVQLLTSLGVALFQGRKVTGLENAYY